MAYDPNSCTSRFPVILVIMPSPLSSYLAGLHVPKKRFYLAVLFIFAYSMKKGLSAS